LLRKLCRHGNGQASCECWRIRISYIDDNLITGEHVTYRARLHWSVLTKPFLLGLLLAAVAAVLFYVAIGGNNSYQTSRAIKCRRRLSSGGRFRSRLGRHLARRDDLPLRECDWVKPWPTPTSFIRQLLNLENCYAGGRSHQKSSRSPISTGLATSIRS